MQQSSRRQRWCSGNGMRFCDNVDDIVEGNQNKGGGKLYQILLLTFLFNIKGRERWNYLIIGWNRTLASSLRWNKVVTQESFTVIIFEHNYSKETFIAVFYLSWFFKTEFVGKLFTHCLSVLEEVFDLCEWYITEMVYFNGIWRWRNEKKKNRQ